MLAKPNLDRGKSRSDNSDDEVQARIARMPGGGDRQKDVLQRNRAPSANPGPDDLQSRIARIGGSGGDRQKELLMRNKGPHDDPEALEERLRRLANGGERQKALLQRSSEQQYEQVLSDAEDRHTKKAKKASKRQKELISQLSGDGFDD